MKTFTQLFLCIIFIHELQAQPDSIRNARYRPIIHLNSSSDHMSGWLYETKDSSLVLMQKNKKDKTQQLARYSLVTYPAGNIDKIKIYRKGRAGKGAFIGFLYGAVPGALIGFLSGDSPSNEIMSFTAGEKALTLGTSFGLVGALIGAIVGSGAEISIPIRGKHENYLKYRKTLADYSIIKK